MAKNVTGMNVRPIRPENTSVATVSEHHQPLVSGFDYTQLDPGKAEVLQKAAAQLRSHNKMLGRSVIVIGQNSSLG